MSPQRQRTFEFIVAYCDQFGSPSYRNIARAIGINLSNVHYHVRALVLDGLLKQEPRKHRTIVVTPAGRKLFVESGTVIRPEPLR